MILSTVSHQHNGEAGIRTPVLRTLQLSLTACLFRGPAKHFILCPAYVLEALPGR